MAKQKTGTAASPTVAGAAVIAGAGVEAGKEVVRDLIKGVGTHITTQFKESFAGLGPKDEGNYNAVVNAWTTATEKRKDSQGQEIETLVFPNSAAYSKKLELWMKEKLTSRQRSWFIRVIANMLTDELTARGVENKQIVSITEAAIVVARELNNLVENYSDENEWVNALHSRRLIKRDYLDEGYRLLANTGQSWDEVAELIKQKTAPDSERRKKLREELEKARNASKERRRKQILKEVTNES